MQIIHSDALVALRSLPDNSVDSIITDPPAGIAFMGKDWDNFSGKARRDGQVLKEEAEKEGRVPLPYGFGGTSTTRKDREAFITFLSEVFTAALRVLRPGGHALVWSLPRTSHWTGYALEEAGFEIRDSIEHVTGSDTITQNFLASLNDEQRTALDMLVESEQSSYISHIFGSGFPKSLAVDKAIDRMMGVKREVIGIYDTRSLYDGRVRQREKSGNNETGYGTIAKEKAAPITAPATPEAKQYAGYGSALKPAHETWWLVRKPLAEPSIAANILAWGVGGLNIAATRVGTGEDRTTGGLRERPGMFMHNDRQLERPTGGRFPANFLLSHSLFCTEELCADGCAVLELDRQSGYSKGHKNKFSDNRSQLGGSVALHDTRSLGVRTPENSYSDQGGASRYFQQFYYCPKPSKAEKSKGCDELPERQGFDKNTSKQIAHVNHATGETTYNEYTPSSTKNTHPTVKPVNLLSFFIRLICPPGGIVLDPFAGSGTTAIAAIQENCDFILIEREQEYIDIINARVKHALAEREEVA